MRFAGDAIAAAAPAGATPTSAQAVRSAPLDAPIVQQAQDEGLFRPRPAAVILWGMCEGERERSTDLEQLRCMLFPHLSREEGWRRIDAAFNRASDSARAERIDRLARHPDLEAKLLQSLWRLAVDEST